jgi:polyisoprenoid-binding protein YceI
MHLPGGTAGLTIDGKSSELVAKELAGVIVVTAKLDCVMEQRGHLSCIKTGNGTREKQLWKYLEAGRYHAATLSVERAKLKVPGDHEKVAGDAMGTLSLHGVQRQLRFHYAAARAGADIQVQGQITIHLTDFNIKQPSFAGVHTGMLAEIRVRFTLRET